MLKEPKQFENINNALVKHDTACITDCVNSILFLHYSCLGYIFHLFWCQILTLIYSHYGVMTCGHVGNFFSPR